MRFAVLSVGAMSLAIGWAVSDPQHAFAAGVRPVPAGPDL